MPDETFLSFIQRWIDEYGTAGRLAESIGMSLSAFSRGVRNERTLGVESCLRLAEETGESPVYVLRLAGKPEIAELLERLYGRRESQLRFGRPERELLDSWNDLTAESQKALLGLMNDLRRSQPLKTAQSTRDQRGRMNASSRRRGPGSAGASQARRVVLRARKGTAT